MKLTSIYRNNYRKTIHGPKDKVFHILSTANSHHHITFEACLENEIRLESPVELHWMSQIYYLGKLYIDFIAVFRYEVSEKGIPSKNEKVKALIKDSFEQFLSSLNANVKQINKKDFYLNDEALESYIEQLKTLLSSLN